MHSDTDEVRRVLRPMQEAFWLGKGIYGEFHGELDFTPLLQCRKGQPEPIALLLYPLPAGTPE